MRQIPLLDASECDAACNRSEARNGQIDPRDRLDLARRNRKGTASQGLEIQSWPTAEPSRQLRCRRGEEFEVDGFALDGRSGPKLPASALPVWCAKFALDAGKTVRLASNYGMKEAELSKIRRILEQNEKTIEEKWNEFDSRKKSKFDLRAIRVELTDDQLCVTLTDGLEIRSPLEFYPKLASAEKMRANFRIMAQGIGIEWTDSNEHLSVEGIVLGRRPIDW